MAPDRAGAGQRPGHTRGGLEPQLRERIQQHPAPEDGEIGKFHSPHLKFSQRSATEPGSAAVPALRDGRSRAAPPRDLARGAASEAFLADVELDRLADARIE